MAFSFVRQSGQRVAAPGRPYPRPREIQPETLNQTCVCGLKRLEHGGARFDGACPGARYGDRRRFRNANPKPRRPSDKPARLPIKAFPSGGPWRILPECPNDTHNTARAAEGRRGRMDAPVPKCICPRARAIAEKRLSEWQATRTGAPRESLRMRARDVTPDPVNKRQPDLSAGNCRRPWNLKIVDAGFDTLASRTAVERREASKALCLECPMLVACRAYTLAEESPPGSWGGIWGGMDAWNRRGQQMTVSPGGQVKLVPYVA